jgi:hypothetical protein
MDRLRTLPKKRDLIRVMKNKYMRSMAPFNAIKYGYRCKAFLPLDNTLKYLQLLNEPVRKNRREMSHSSNNSVHMFASEIQIFKLLRTPSQSVLTPHPLLAIRL